VVLTPGIGIGSGSSAVLVLRALEMVRGRWYPALPTGTERPWTIWKNGRQKLAIATIVPSVELTMLQITRNQTTTSMVSATLFASSRGLPSTIT